MVLLETVPMVEEMVVMVVMQVTGPPTLVAVEEGQVVGLEEQVVLGLLS